MTRPDPAHASAQRSRRIVSSCARPTKGVRRAPGVVKRRLRSPLDATALTPKLIIELQNSVEV